MSKASLYLLLAFSACTDASLYGKNYTPNQPNRISFEGNLCTDDPGAIAFPQKTLIVMDGTGALAEGDPAGKRVDTLRAFIGRHRGPNQAVSILLMGNSARPLTTGFTSDQQTIENVMMTILTALLTHCRQTLDRAWSTEFVGEVWFRKIAKCVE